MKLTAKRLRKILHYDPLTGVFTWRIARRHLIGKVAGHLKSTGYWVIKIDQVAYGAHRLAWLYVYGQWPTGLIDHEDTIPHHNWIGNLRPATDSQNAANRKVRASGVKGVTRHPSGKWQSQIKHKGRNHYLGLHETQAEAAEAYRLKAVQLHGEYARAA